MILLSLAAFARPTDGGTYAFDSSDTVLSVDSASGAVRVWYSAEGNNQVLQGDDDSSGVPDFAEEVAATTEDVLAFYADAGFRTIPDDGNGGGSAAMDVYLVDFAGNADGHYSTESCSGNVCSGYFVMENDFSGYGYSSVSAAIRTLTSHELFHGIQGAYDYAEEVWYQEGTAVWAERLYDPDNDDFLYFCDAYLDDVTRSLNEPPAGPVPTFAYATALWWWFVTNRYGDPWMVDYLDATTGDDDLLDLLDARVDLSADWVDFAAWNLATGGNAGVAESYPFASAIGPPVIEDRGDTLDDDQRFYPLATTYYRLTHEGGALQFSLDADAPDVVFQLWSTDADDTVDSLVAEPTSTVGIQELGDFAEGTYFLMGTNPTLAEDSTKVRFCLGPDVSDCVPEVEDTGATDTGGKQEPGACGCAATPGAGWLGLMVVVGMVGRRRPIAV